jgi:DNA-binding GntR family transcriptional regulator
MSRTPVRGAFQQLEPEGLLKLYPKKGALVVPVSAQELEEVIETRWVIERYAIERAALGFLRGTHVPFRACGGRRRRSP